MTTYLSLDGVDDYILTSSISFTKIVMDIKISTLTAGINNPIIDGRKDISSLYVFASGASGAPYARFDFSGISVLQDGVLQAGGRDFLTLDKRVILEGSRGATATGRINIFSDYNNTRPLKGDIYDVKFYNGDTLTAHYDMSTGTMLDQSGNGKHGTLVGGTWVYEQAGGIKVFVEQEWVSCKAKVFDKGAWKETNLKYYDDVQGKWSFEG